MQAKGNILERTDLPDRQAQVLDFLEEYIDVAGYPPSILEIADSLGVSSTFGIRKHLEALEKKGFIRRAEAGSARSLLVLRPSQERRGVRRSSSIPVLGRVTAGEPILAVENVEGWLAFKPNKSAESMFALRVEGHSMKDKGIMSGDYVICRQQNTAENGEIVVALLDDSATVKTFRRMRGGAIQLEPANDKFRPIPIDEDSNFQILGKVASVFRAIDDRRPGLIQMNYS